MSHSVRALVTPIQTHEPPLAAETTCDSAVRLTRRIANIDRLRVLAAIGIVWFHTEGAPGRRLGYVGLPIFLLVFVSLLARQGRTGSTKGFLVRRWRRLLKPWLFWSVVYALCRLVNAVRLEEPSSFVEILSARFIFVGSNIHLWYLPYAFFSGIVIYELNRWIPKARDITVSLVALVVGILTLVLCAITTAAFDLPVPLSQWQFGLSSLPLGYAIGRSLSVPSRRFQIGLLATICLTVLVTCISLHVAGYRLGLTYGLAMPLVCMAYVFPGRWDAAVGEMASLTYGIYLIHPLVGYSLSQSAPLNGHYVLLIILTAGVSGLLTFGVKKTPFREFV